MGYWDVPWHLRSVMLAKACGISEEAHWELSNRCRAAESKERADAMDEERRWRREVAEEEKKETKYKQVTIRELAIKSVELSEENDRDHPIDMADTIQRHWVRGALHFKLPLLGFTEDMEDEDNFRECEGVSFRAIPKEINKALREYFKGDFHRPGPKNFNPEVKWKGQRWMLIDLLPEATLDDDGRGYDRIARAIFIPADAIRR